MDGPYVSTALKGIFESSLYLFLEGANNGCTAKQLDSHLRRLETHMDGMIDNNASSQARASFGSRCIAMTEAITAQGNGRLQSIRNRLLTHAKRGRDLPSFFDLS